MSNQPAADLARSLADLVQCELKLAKIELKEAVGKSAKRAIFGLVFSVLAAAGVLPLIAFLVIGLGQILGDRYWLSSLIVGAAFSLIGAIGAVISFKSILRKESVIPVTLQTSQANAIHVRDQLASLSEIKSRRSA